MNINNCIAIDIDEIVQRQLQLQMKLILIQKVCASCYLN
ncbi:hypothetical protein RintRC_5802 [Richelia intracellularis]|nr:hypothetical protein RintRC_5802 [Richelia intracellularis]